MTVSVFDPTGTDNLEVIADLVAAQHGIGLNGIAIAVPYFEAGTLVPLLKEWSHEIPPVKIFYSSRKDLPARMRVFIDFVCENVSAPEL